MDVLLDIQDISIAYNSVSIISKLSLALKSGERLVIEGPNGCGKTTLLKAILGNVKPVSGKIILSENAKIAYCKQGFAETKAPISVTEVVSMGLYKAKGTTKNSAQGKSTPETNTQATNKAKVQQALQQAGVSHLANRAFNELSGGEKQRVNLARCFCQDANLLLLDEPSSFLDASFRDEFASMMQELPTYMSAIVVTHDAQLTQALGWPVVKMVQTQVESPAQAPHKEAPCRE